MNRQIAIDNGTTTSVIYYRDSNNGVEKGGTFISFGDKNYVPSVILPAGTVTNNKGKTVHHAEEEYGWDAESSYSFHSLLERNFKMELLSPDPDVRAKAAELTHRFFRFLYQSYIDGNETVKDETYEDISTLVTYPAKFSEEAKSVFQEAAEKAGFPNVRLCLEAEGAMQYALRFDSEETKQFFTKNKGKTVKTMLIDMGAGTTDIAIYSCNPGKPGDYQLLTCYPKENGHSFGGGEIDQKLSEFYKKTVPMDLAHALCPKNPKLGAILLEDRMKAYKEKLSRCLAKGETMDPQQEIASLYYYATQEELELEFDQDLLENILEDYLPQLPELVEGALKEANLAGDQIDLVLLTGGHSQWYFVKQLLRQTSLKLDDKQILTFSDPHLVVAKGAAHISVHSDVRIPFGQKRIMIFENDLVGYADENGNVVIPCQWEEATKFEHERAFVVKDGLVGMIDPAGKLIAPHQWDYGYIYWLTEKRICIAKGQKWGLIDQNGTLLVPYQWELISKSTGNRIFVRKDEKWGMIDQDGKLICDYQWDGCSPFKNGFAKVYRNKEELTIDRTGRVCHLDSEVQDGVRLVERDGKWGAADVNGNYLVEPIYEGLHRFRDGLAAAQINGLWGYINKQGKVVIQPQWNNARSFYEDRAGVQNEYGLWGFIDKNGRLVVSYHWNKVMDYHDGAAIVFSGDTFDLLLAGLASDHEGRFAYIGKDGSMIGDRMWKEANLFSDGMAKVKTEAGWTAYMDKSGKVIHGGWTTWENGKDFHDGRAAVMVKRWGKNKWGYIDKSGKKITAYDFDTADSFRDGVAWVGKDGKYYKIDRNGNLVDR